MNNYVRMNRMRKDRDGTRRRVVRHDGVEGYWVTCTSPCSGCTVCDNGNTSSRGLGCTECGHTGKRRVMHWAPFDLTEWARSTENRAMNAIRTRAFYRRHGRHGTGRIVQVVSIGKKRGIIVVAFCGGGIAKMDMRTFARDYLRVSRADVEAESSRMVAAEANP